MTIITLLMIKDVITSERKPNKKKYAVELMTTVKELITQAKKENRTD